jgi:hypothetical protein
MQRQERNVKITGKRLHGGDNRVVVEAGKFGIVGGLLGGKMEVAEGDQGVGPKRDVVQVDGVAGGHQCRGNPFPAGHGNVTFGRCSPQQNSNVHVRVCVV